MAEAKGILIIGELAAGEVDPVTYELLGAARSLAPELGQEGHPTKSEISWGPQEVAAALLGSDMAGPAQELSQALFARGADRVYIVDDPLLAEYRTDPFLEAATKLCQQTTPAIVILGQTDMGRDLAPRLAFRLATAVAMDCVALAVKDGRLVMSRPCYGGNLRADYTCQTMPQMATLRAKAFEPLAPEAGRRGSVERLAPGLAPEAARTAVVGRSKAEAAGVRLEDAEVVVGGGRGLGGPEGFRGLEELAQLLGGAVGATRAVCDLGWYPVASQIGLTGKVITPTLYIAVAISGASQHMAGCSNSRYIVAVNKDPEATIFKAARFGIVADYKQVVPPLIAALRELKG